MSEERPALVLLHAFGASSRAWSAVAGALGAGWQVLSPDLPGFGGAADLPEPSVAAYADWVAAQVEAAGLGRAVLGGWSMGGKIALALAARRPSWLAALMLAAPSPVSPEPMDEADRARQLAGWGDRALAERSVREAVGAPLASATLAEAVAERLATSERAWRWWLEAGSREYLDLGGPPIDIPALVVVGTKDADLGEAPQRRLTLPRLASGRLERLEGCGHFLPLEAPQALAERIGAWAATAG